jgi:hypothetical protein
VGPAELLRPQEMLRDFSVVGLQMHKHTNPLDSLMWLRPCRERPNDPGTRHSDELPPPHLAPQSNLRGLAGEQLSARGAASSGGSSAVQRQSGLARDELSNRRGPGPGANP